MGYFINALWHTYFLKVQNKVFPIKLVFALMVLYCMLFKGRVEIDYVLYSIERKSTCGALTTYLQAKKWCPILKSFLCRWPQNFSMSSFECETMAGPSPCLTACRLAKRFKPSHKICRLWSKTPSGPALRVTHSSLQNHVVLSSEKIHITRRSLMVALKQWRRSHAHTMEWRCNALKYFKILHRSLQEVTYNINHMLLVEKKALTGHLWGVLFLNLLQKLLRYNATALYMRQ